MFDREKEIARQLQNSANYQFCNNYLPSLFFYKPGLFTECLVDKKKLVETLTVVFNIMKEDGIDIDSLMKVGFTAKLDREKKVVGIILSVPDPKIEPECNFVCTAFFDMEPKYFESELYEEGYFGLCGREEHGGHINYGHIGGDIRTAEDFWKAIVSLKK